MSESTYVYVDARTLKSKEGVKIQISWGVAVWIDLDLLRQCGMGEASIEQHGPSAACHEIRFPSNAGVKEQATALAAYFGAIANPPNPEEKT